MNKKKLFKTMNRLLLLTGILIASNAEALITLDSTNKTAAVNIGGYDYYYWPMTPAATTAYPAACENASLWPPTLSRLSVTSSELIFRIASSVSGAGRYVHAELVQKSTGVSSTSTYPLNIVGADIAHPTYLQYTSDSTQEFHISLSHLCNTAGASAGYYNGATHTSCLDTTAAPVSASAAATKEPLLLRIGVINGTGSNFTPPSTGDTSQDFTHIYLNLVPCASFDPSTTSAPCGALTTATCYSTRYDVAAQPGDGRARVLILSDAPNVGNSHAFKSTLIMLERSSTSRTTPLATSTATAASEVPSLSAGVFSVDGLTNDATYNVQIGYVNYAGLVTPPGPPWWPSRSGVSTDGAAAPTVTPSQVDGFLNRSNCFIATAAYSHEWDPRLETLRQFRDEILEKFNLGRHFVKWYYSWSEDSSHWLLQHPQYKYVIRMALIPVVEIAAASLWVREHLWFVALLAFISILSLVTYWRVRPRSAPFFMIFFSVVTAAVVTAPFAFAASLEDSSQVQPYIDSLRKKNNIQEQEAAAQNETAEPYIEKLRKENKIEIQEPRSDEAYIEKIRKDHHLEPQKSNEPQPYLEAVKAGHELEPKYKGVVKHAMGIVINTGSTLNVSSGGAQANSFESVYRTQKTYNPGLDLYYEYHLLRDRVWGALGPMGRVGFLYAKGYGRFTKLGTESDVTFNFIATPVTLGAVYRAVQPRFIVPFIQPGIALIPMLETRSDERPSRKSFSYGFNLTYGVSLNLDWLSRRKAWERYDAYGVLHTYLLIQQQRMKTLGGPVDFDYVMTMAGVGFEM